MPEQAKSSPQVGSTEQTVPISLIPSREVLPRKYVIHRHSQVCKNCGTLHEWSACYAFNNMQSRMQSGKLVVNLVPVDHFDWNLPIEVVSAPRKTVAACHECAPTFIDLSHLPDPRRSVEWQELYSIARAPQRNTDAKTKKPTQPHQRKKKTYTIDDLL